ncbi:MAG: M20/M25/M40 family metallo-hydrolase, partial [Anaerolineales bacterium]|nr:M20/M25/M40 family metallo-hydrolase [Anaerolineales bacterium]
LQGIAARNVPPLKAAVISVCTIHGGETFNVIPSEVELTGTIRTFDLDVRQSVLERFEQTVRSTAEGLGCRVEIDLHRLTPALVNNSTITARVQETAQQLFPDSDLITGGYITMGSEDMAFFLERVPGCFFFVGSANPEKGLDAAHHHPRFDFDEAVLPRAAALLAASAAAILNSEIRA